jgi:hypothetical protein
MPEWEILNLSANPTLPIVVDMIADRQEKAKQVYAGHGKTILNFALETSAADAKSGSSFLPLGLRTQKE